MQWLENGEQQDLNLKSDLNSQIFKWNFKNKNS